VIEKIHQAILLTEHALADVKFAAEEERRISHNKHISGFYRRMINELETKLDCERAALKKQQVLQQIG
jgi:hypothetical protein